MKIAGQKVYDLQTFATVLWVFPLECPKVEISLGFGEPTRDSPSNVPEMSNTPLIKGAIKRFPCSISRYATCVSWRILSTRARAAGAAARRSTSMRTLPAILIIHMGTNEWNASNRLPESIVPKAYPSISKLVSHPVMRPTSFAP